jgi:hypothetical protein
MTANGLKIFLNGIRRRRRVSPLASLFDMRTAFGETDMRRIWLVGTAIAAFIAVPTIDMHAQAASFAPTQTTTSGTTTTDAADDWFDLACSCGGGEGGGGEGGGDSGGGDSGGGDSGGGASGGGATGGGTSGGGTEGGREGTGGETGDDLPQ